MVLVLSQTILMHFYIFLQHQKLSFNNIIDIGLKTVRLLLIYLVAVDCSKHCLLMQIIGYWWNITGSTKGFLCIQCITINSLSNCHTFYVKVTESNYMIVIILFQAYFLLFYMPCFTRRFECYVIRFLQKPRNKNVSFIEGFGSVWAKFSLKIACTCEN